MAKRRRSKYYGRIRDLIRIGIIGVVAGVSLLFSLSPDLVIGTIFMMVGWRLRTGW